MNKKLLFIATFFFHLLAQAEDSWKFSCSGITEFLHVHVENSDPLGAAVDCNDVQKLRETYIKVARLSPLPLPPPVVFIQNRLTAQGMSFEMARNFFNTSVQLDTPGNPRMQDLMQKIFAHEVGHQIFFTFWMDQFGAFAQLKAKRDPFLITLIETRKTKDGEQIEEDKDYKEFMSVMNERRTPLPLSDAEEIFYSLGTSYQELFADIVAAVAYEDPDVNETGSDEFYHNDLNLPSRSLQENLPITLKTAVRPYYYFASVRSEIWNKWVVPRMHNKPQLLQDLMVIFTLDIMRRYKAQEYALRGTEDEFLQLNKKNADELLKALGIPRE